MSTSATCLAYHMGLGRHNCLWCLITSEQLKIPLTTRGAKPPRTLQSIKDDYARFLSNGGVHARAKEYNNAMAPHFLVRSVHQACILHSESFIDFFRCWRMSVISWTFSWQLFQHQIPEFHKSSHRSLDQVGSHGDTPYYRSSVCQQETQVAVDLGTSAPELKNVVTLCNSVSQLAEARCPQLVAPAEFVSKTFTKVFTLFAACHKVYDSKNRLEESDLDALGE